LLKFDIYHFDIFDDSGTVGSGAFCQSLGGVFRVGVSIVGLEPGCFEIIGVQQGKQFFCLIQADFLHLDTEGTCHLHGAVVFFLAGLGLGHPDGAGTQIPGGLSGFFFQAGIEICTINR